MRSRLRNWSWPIASGWLAFAALLIVVLALNESKPNSVVAAVVASNGGASRSLVARVHGPNFDDCHALVPSVDVEEGDSSVVLKPNVKKGRELDDFCHSGGGSQFFVKVKLSRPLGHRTVYNEQISNLDRVPVLQKWQRGNNG
jgi:hypothetical protein